MGSLGWNSQPWEFLVIRDLEIREKIVEIFKTQMRDKIEIEEATRGQRRRVNAGVNFRHAPVHGYRRTRRIRAHEIATEMLPEPRPRFETRNSLPAFETLVAVLPEAQREVVTMLKAGGLKPGGSSPRHVMQGRRREAKGEPSLRAPAQITAGGKE